MLHDWSTIKKLIWFRGSNAGGGSSSVLKIVSGTILQITDALARTAYQLKVTIVPKQESGTPSPDNILPITGWTGCDISHTSGNIIDAVTDNKVPKNDSKVTVSGGVLTAKTNNATEAGLVVPVLPNTQYTIGFNITTGGNAAYFRCAEYSAKPNTYGSGYRTRIIEASDTATGNGTLRRVITTGDNARWLFFGIYRSYNSAEKKIKDWYVRFGNTQDGYAEHQGEEIPVSWESEAGTVYGGTLTINEDGSADLERDSALNTSRGTYSTWESFGSGSSKYYRYKLSSETNYITNRSSAICTHFARTTISASTTDIGFQIQLVTSGTSAQKGTWIAFRPDLSVYDTLTKFKNYVEEQYENGTPVQYFVYYTDVRATYHFDNIGQLHMYLGENNIWVEGTNVGMSNKVGTGMADYMTLTQ